MGRWSREQVDSLKITKKVKKGKEARTKGNYNQFGVWFVRTEFRSFIRWSRFGVDTCSIIIVYVNTTKAWIWRSSSLRMLIIQKWCGSPSLVSVFNRNWSLLSSAVLFASVIDELKNAFLIYKTKHEKPLSSHSSDHRQVYSSLLCLQCISLLSPSTKKTPDHKI